MSEVQTYPRLERDCQIEVPAPRNGRPGYRWVNGWIIRYTDSRVSISMPYKEARALLAELNEGRTQA